MIKIEIYWPLALVLLGALIYWLIKLELGGM
jgi:hypothetical protein